MSKVDGPYPFFRIKKNGTKKSQQSSGNNHQNQKVLSLNKDFFDGFVSFLRIN